MMMQVPEPSEASTYADTAIGMKNEASTYADTATGMKNEARTYADTAGLLSNNHASAGSQQQLISAMPQIPEETTIKASTRLVYALLIFVMLRECLQAVLQLTGVVQPQEITVFCISIGLILLLDALPGSRLLRGLGQVVVVLSVIGLYYYAAVFPDMSWLGSYWTVTREDFELVLSGLWNQVSLESRTVLFLVGWATLGSVLLRLVEFSRPLWLVGSVLTFLLFAQLGPGLDTSAGMIRAAAAGLALAALQSMHALRTAYAPAVAASGGLPPARSAGRLLSVLLITAACLAAGSAVAMDKPLAANPPDWQRLGETIAMRLGGAPPRTVNGAEARSASAGKTGYSRDDSRLGGPVTPDDSIAFTAKTPRLTYWRGETKSIYTGLGWESDPSDATETARIEETASGQRLYFLQDSESTDKPSGTDDTGSISSSSPTDSTDFTSSSTIADSSNSSISSTPVPKDLIIQTVTLDTMVNNRLFAGGDVVAVDSLLTRQGAPYPAKLVEYDKSNAVLRLTGGSGPLASYRIVVSMPVDNPDKLRSTSETYQADFVDRYLSLPASVPDRVKELAASITAGAANPYDKATAIAAFLQANYTYSLDKAKVAPVGRDFADYFLFESKNGYCDYFSTAMVVLLRSSGIPARWVKGFAPGEITSPISGQSTRTTIAAFSSTDDSANYSVTVRNSDAHSWVEVYFPQVGWISFDPTPTQGVSAVITNQQATRSISEEGEQAEQNKLQRRVKAIFSSMSTFIREKRDGIIISLYLTDWQQFTNNVLGKEGLTRWHLLAGTVMTLIICGFLFRRFYKSGGEITVVDIPKSSAKRDKLTQWHPANRTERKLAKVWRKVYHKHGDKLPAQTMREYAESLQLTIGEAASAIVDLVCLSEQAIYDPNPGGRISMKRLAQLRSSIGKRGKPRDEHMTLRKPDDNLRL
ncbi:MAG: DUF3488 and transglutaminase-like domain-containing protein [Gorillibacterium sp.]|nr:DUF3488 and transglutaminase-like domain-containing protein [Gorillibacterium sp.]